MCLEIDGFLQHFANITWDFNKTLNADEKEVVWHSDPIKISRDR